MDIDINKICAEFEYAYESCNDIDNRVLETARRLVMAQLANECGNYPIEKVQEICKELDNLKLMAETMQRIFFKL